MDSTVIQEIANQLEMAVDDAGVFIQQYLPQYANLQILYNILSAITWLAFIVITVVVARRVFNYQCDNMNGDFCITNIVISKVIIVFIILNLVCNVANTIGWAMFPEASLIDMVFDCIGQ